MGKRLMMKPIGRICGLGYCKTCDRVEWMRKAGPFFFICDECRTLIPRELEG